MVVGVGAFAASSLWLGPIIAQAVAPLEQLGRASRDLLVVGQAAEGWAGGATLAFMVLTCASPKQIEAG